MYKINPKKWSEIIFIKANSGRKWMQEYKICSRRHSSHAIQLIISAKINCGSHYRALVKMCHKRLNDHFDSDFFEFSRKAEMRFNEISDTKHWQSWAKTIWNQCDIYLKINKTFITAKHHSAIAETQCRLYPWKVQLLNIFILHLRFCSQQNYCNNTLEGKWLGTGSNTCKIEK